MENIAGMWEWYIFTLVFGNTVYWLGVRAGYKAAQQNRNNRNR